ISAGYNDRFTIPGWHPGVEDFGAKRIRYHGAGRTDIINIKRCAIMKRRNADCGKIRRPIKKNKIAEHIGSNTLLYLKFLLLWLSVITADYLLEFRFEFLWPFWLLLRSIYDSYKYKGLAFSVLFVCIAVTSDLVCLFFIPVQWLFFAASTYVWVQYVWHTDKGICLPTIILWILFVYLEAAIRWKESRNIPHLNLCRPFAAHCIGYPVVTLGFGFKSYVGYRIRQRKQREVAKDNDFYMQLLQEALPKEESRVLEPLADGATGTGGSEQMASPKELVPVAMSNKNNSLNNSSSSTASNRSDTGQHHHHNHHHHNHQQQQHQHHTNHSKSTQSYKSSSSSSTVTTAHVNGHVSGSNSSSSSSSTMNGGLNHSSHQQQGSSKHRKSLDKDSSASSNSSSNSSSTLNAVSKMNGGSGGGGGTCYFPQPTTFQQSGNNGSSSSSSSSSTSSNSSSSNSSNSGSTTISTKEFSNAVNRGNDHNGSIHCNGGTAGKDSKEGTVHGLTARKDYDKEINNSSNSAGSNSCSSSSSGKHGNGQNSAFNRSKSPTDVGALGNKSDVGKQNGHIAQYHQPELVQQVTGTEITTPSAESKGGSSGRSGRKNRLKKAAEQANLSAIAKLCATLALASSVTTLTTTNTATTSSGDKGTTITSSSYTSTGSVSSASVKDNHQQNGEQVKEVGDASRTSSCSGSSAEGKPEGNVSSLASGTHKATPTATVSSPAVATVFVQKVCEACPRLEGDLKKLRAELSSHRQTENELRQKYDSNTNNLKACLQAKQKDYDELQNRYQEHCNQRQQERQNLQTVERRLGEERRHRQSLEAQLNNERKYRKQAEEKAARAECGEACKMKKQQMEIDIEKLQNELHHVEDAKLMVEKQARNYEQEMRKLELQLRNRESQQNTEVLMSALAAMQDKNATLEKSLSAETRVKLDLFSVLGGTRREVEILTSSLRDKEKEILELNAKIVQLLAVMPSENLCLASHGGGTGTDGGSMMRLADAPQLLPQSMTSGHLNGIGPSSGGGGGVGGGGGPVAGGGGGGMNQQPSPMAHMVQNGPTFCSQLGSLGVLTSTMTTLPSSSVLSGPNSSTGNGSNGGQIVQMQNTNNGGPNAVNCPSGLDPNATIYTPKNNGMIGGTEA
uniref:Macoilin n=1 Tax=Anopheles culicifacies TaxID=139723 RepID=A0A182M7W0_9DIPT